MDIFKNLSGHPGESNWLNLTQKFLHDDFPRYSIYSFQKVNSSFRIDDPLYLEGVLNYSVLFFFFLLISLLLIVTTILLVHLNIIQYNWTNVAIYKTLVSVFGFLAFLCTVLAFVGFTMISSSITFIVRHQITPAQDVVKEFRAYLKIVVDGVFGFLENIEASLVASTGGGSILDFIKDQAIGAVALPTIREGLKGKAPAKQLLVDVQGVVDLLETLKFAHKTFFTVGILYLLYSVIMCLWLTSSGCKSKGTGACVCRFPLCLLIVWWLIGAITIPMALALSDICSDPVRTIARILPLFIPQLSEQIGLYYLGCIEPNPLQHIMDIIYNVIKYILGPLAKGIVMLAGPLFAEIKEPVQTAQVYFERILADRGCIWSSQLTNAAFSKVCTSLLLGIAILAFSAALTAIFLTFAVMSCLKLREFKGWPESKTRKYPCPPTCKVHELFEQNIPPCPMVRRVSSIELPKIKKYLCRSTCPETCRGYSEYITLPDQIRATCPKTCKGQLQWKEPEPPKEPKIQPVKKYKKLEYKKAKNKGAVCCIELPANIECIPEGKSLSNWNKDLKKKLKEKFKKPCFDDTCEIDAATNPNTPAENQQQPGSDQMGCIDNSCKKPAPRGLSFWRKK